MRRRPFIQLSSMFMQIIISVHICRINKEIFRTLLGCPWPTRQSWSPLRRSVLKEHENNLRVHETDEAPLKGSVCVKGECVRSAMMFQFGTGMASGAFAKVGLVHDSVNF